MDSTTLMLASMVMLATGLALGALFLVLREWHRSRTGALLDRAIRGRIDEPKGAPAPSGSEASDALPQRDEDGPAVQRELPVHWLDNVLGRLLVAEEDRRLILQSGFSPVQAQLLFLVARMLLTPLLPLLVWLLLPHLKATQGGGALLMAAIGVGFMAPKWWLGRRAAIRRRRVAQELPLFVDLLRLLQGVGLGLDQGMQVMADDFDKIMFVLGPELALANRQYRQGRTREQSLQRLATLYGNENLAAMVALIVQTDRHGGAVQEPLRQFGERLREQRRSEMKGRIGRITVKMTGVMVTTLLPALIIVTAGPGFLAVIRALGSMGQ